MASFPKQADLNQVCLLLHVWQNSFHNTLYFQMNPAESLTVSQNALSGGLPAGCFFECSADLYRLVRTETMPCCADRTVIVRKTSKRLPAESAPKA